MNLERAKIKIRNKKSARQELLYGLLRLVHSTEHPLPHKMKSEAIHYKELSNYIEKEKFDLDLTPYNSIAKDFLGEYYQE